MSEKVPPSPAGAGPAGRRLWQSVVREYVLAEHELALLREAVRVADTCAQLQAIVDREGPLVSSSSGPRTHPALVEARQQRVLLARLLVALRVPIGDAEEQPSTHAPPRLQRRGTRGAYGPRAVA
jgi:hypothetical protein